MSEPTVGSAMTRCPIAVGPDAKFAEIAKLLSGCGISAVPVVDSTGRPIGVVSEADLLRRQEHKGDGPRPPLFSGSATRQEWRKATALTAHELMTAPVLTVSSTEPLQSAACRLARAKVRRLFVVDGGRLVGVLSRRDLLRVYLRDDEDIRDQITNDVLPRMPEVDPALMGISVDNGVVTLLGRVDWRSDCAVVEGQIRAVPGVVDVRNRLRYVWNDDARRQGHDVA